MAAEKSSKRRRHEESTNRSSKKKSKKQVEPADVPEHVQDSENVNKASKDDAQREDKETTADIAKTTKSKKSRYIVFVGEWN